MTHECFNAAITLSMEGFSSSMKESLFTYSSVRYVNVEAKCPAIIYRLLQFIVLVYVIAYSVVLRQAYQVLMRMTYKVSRC